jgi:TonB family protein
MINLFNYFLEANVVLLAFALVYYSLLVKQSNFQFRRFFILSATFCAVVVPLVSINLGQNIVPQSLVSAGITTIMLDEVVLSAGLEGSAFSFFDQHWSIYLIICYALISALFLVGFINQLLSIKNILSNKSIKRSKHRGYTLIETTNNYPTFSFFGILIFRNYDNINESERNQIIAHEEVHIHQWHSLDVVFLEVMKVVFWINPGIWFFRKSQVENHEYIVDEKILQHHDRSEYQQLLVKMTVDQMQLVGNYFAKIQTLKRINMMNEKRRKPNRLKIATALLSALLIVTALACNEELVEVAQSAEMVLELPLEGQEAMNLLNQKFPKEKFVYVEVNNPVDHNLRNTFENNNIDQKTIQFMFEVPERNKMGLILSTTENFHKLSNMTKYNDMLGNEIFDIVEDQPAPVGGMAEFYKYIGTNMKYPKQARSLGIEGRVFVQFIVDKEGNLTKVVAVKGIGAGCDEEAVRVIENAPKWNPGKQRGETVNVRMILPITYKLDGPDENTQNHNPENLDNIKAPQMEETVVIGHLKSAQEEVVIENIVTEKK